MTAQTSVGERMRALAAITATADQAAMTTASRAKAAYLIGRLLVECEPAALEDVFITLTGDGTVQMEWEGDGRSAEIELSEPADTWVTTDEFEEDALGIDAGFELLLKCFPEWTLP